jgi:hypothetical protein
MDGCAARVAASKSPDERVNLLSKHVSRDVSTEPVLSEVEGLDMTDRNGLTVAAAL